MYKLLIIMGLFTVSMTAAAQDSCKKKLEDIALTTFDATEFRDARFPTAAEANMDAKYKEVTVFQYKAKYRVTYQLKDEDINLCEIEAETALEASY